MMKNKMQLLPYVLSVFLTACAATSKSIGNQDDTQAAKALANAYISATHEGDAERMKDLFHESALMSGYILGQKSIGDPSPFLDQLSGNPSLKSSGAPYEARITYVDVRGDTASVTIEETGFGDLNFTNYLHLLKEEGQWRIISKTYFGYKN